METKKQMEEYLAHVLLEHVQHNTILLAIIKEERQCIIHNMFTQLEELHRRKGELCRTIEDNEKKRIAITTALCKHLDLSAADTKLAHLIDAVDEPYKSTFRNYHGRLKTLLTDIRRCSGSNRILIQNSLRFHENSFMLLMGVVQKDTNYVSSGTMATNQKRLVDSIV